MTEGERLDRIASAVIDAAIAVHRELGPGLLEPIYEACMECELVSRGHVVEKQKPVPVVYGGVAVDWGYRLGMLIDRAVVVENRAVGDRNPVHAARLLAYLKLSGYKLGLLFNFNVESLRDGIHRLVVRSPE